MVQPQLLRILFDTTKKQFIAEKKKIDIFIIVKEVS